MVNTSKVSSDDQQVLLKTLKTPKEGRMFFILAASGWITLLGLTSLVVMLNHQKQIQLDALHLQLQHLTLRMEEIRSGRYRREVELGSSEINPDSAGHGEDFVNPLDKSEGLRVYDAFFQHRNPNHIPRNQDDDSDELEDSEDGIRPHHRMSAAWVEREPKSKHETSPQFGEQVFRKASSSRTFPANHKRIGSAIDLPQQNRAKETGRVKTTTMTTTTSATPASTSSISEANFMYSESVTSYVSQNESTDEEPEVKAKLWRNKAGTRSGGKRLAHRRLKGRAEDFEASAGFHGLRAIQYVGQKSGDGVHLSEDGFYKMWTPARWSMKINAHHHFPMDHLGKIEIKHPGVYFIYAQVNYLDEHDVNSFEVSINDQTFLVCTTMTMTGYPTNKTNSCFTAGIHFLESHDQVYLRDLEPHRQALIRPTHTFFGGKCGTLQAAEMWKAPPEASLKGLHTFLTNCVDHFDYFLLNI